MLSRLAPFIVRRRRLVLLVALLAVVLAGAVGGGVAERLTTGGFEDPAAESTRAADYLTETFGTGQPDVVLLATADDGSVDSPATQAAGADLTAEMAAFPGVSQAFSYWSLGSPPPLRSTSGEQAMVLLRLAGDEDAQDETTAALNERFAESQPAGLAVEVGGRSAVFHEVGHVIEGDLVRAELIALPITLLLLVLVFGSVVAALLPLAVGIIAVMGTFAILFGLSGVTDVSIYALNLTTALGLGLAIDYSLFIVSRYREELAAGNEPWTAVIRTVRTAGRTVLFSAATVAISLAALLVFPFAFLKSFAYAGIAVSATAAVGAVVVLPALLAVLGRRVDSLRVLKRRDAVDGGNGIWHRIATFVMKRPVGIATAVVIVLLVLGSPFLRITFGQPDDRVLPPGNEVRAVQDELRAGFDGNEATTVEVVVPELGVADPSLAAPEIGAYASQLSTLQGTVRVDALTGSYVGGTKVAEANPASARFAGDGATWFSVVPSVEPMSPAGEQLVHEIRDLNAPFDTLVGGQSAQLVDAKDSLFSRLPLALAFISIVTLVVLFLLFGSVLVPLKALVLNFLSLSATFGAMVWIFQDGHLASALGFTPTGTIDVSMPILMFCIAFGLSMDYEVFLLSRIKEEHDRGADTETSVAVGLEKTGRIVTAAAVLMAVVFTAFGTSGITFLKMFGLGLALAVLMDAFLIRSTLVPAFMRLAGELNWWAPRPLRRLHDRIGISETVDLDEPGGTVAGVDESHALVGSRE